MNIYRLYRARSILRSWQDFPAVFKGVSQLKDKDLKVPNVTKYIKCVLATANYKEIATD